MVALAVADVTAYVVSTYIVSAWGRPIFTWTPGE
jgi:hypothetical protein